MASAAEEAWEEVHRRLHEWARVLRVKGVAALLETITLVEGLPGRLLSKVDGERHLTDLRHVGQLLHAAAAAERLGATALTGWLRQRIAAAEQETGDEERSRRLESDAEAVQVLTIHRSKGLEFPVVYFPYLWEPTWLGHERRSRCSSTTPTTTTRARSTSRSTGGRSTSTSQQYVGRGARRGPAARLRRADPRAPPGGRVVGGLVQRARLGALAAAVRARRGRHGRAEGPGRRRATSRP